MCLYTILLTCCNQNCTDDQRERKVQKKPEELCHDQEQIEQREGEETYCI